MGLNTAVFCDDIRAEVGGKLSLMGVISGDIYPLSFPVTLKVGAYLELSPPFPEPFTGKVIIKGGNVEVNGEIGATLKRPDMVSQMAIPAQLFMFDAPGAIEITIMVGDETYKAIKSVIWNAEVAATLQSNAWQPQPARSPLAAPAS